MKRNLHILDYEQEMMERYLLDQMNTEEKMEFQQRLQTDQELAEKTETVRLIIIGIKEAALAERLDEFHNSITTTKRPSRLIFVKRMLIAASVIVFAALGIFLFLNSQSNTRLYKQYYSPDPGLIGTMSNTGEEYEFATAMVDYKIKNYDKAIRVWKSLLSTKPDSDTLNYFIASAYMAKGESSRAKPFLQKVILNNNSFFNKDACWYYGLALIKEEKTKEAVPYIEKSNHEDKDTLLRQLKN